MPFGIIFIIIALELVVGLVAGLIMWTSSGGRGSNEMACGSCGYEVRGLTQLFCPECGVDLREAGIRPGGSPSKRRTGVSLTLFCGAFLLLGCGMSGWLFLSAGKSVSVPASPAMSMPSTTSSSSPIQNADGSNTIVNPDGSKIVIHPDGSSTLIETDGTMKTFDSNGVETDTPDSLTQPDDTGEAPEVPEGQSP